MPLVLLALTGTLAASGPAASGPHHDETGSQSDPAEKILITRDADGNVLSKSVSVSVTDGNSIMTKTTHSSRRNGDELVTDEEQVIRTSYDESGRRVKEETDTYRYEGQVKRHYLTTDTYDTSGNLVKRVNMSASSMPSDIAGLTETGTVEYTYDVQNRRVAEMSSSRVVPSEGTDGTWIRNRSEYRYDDNGKLYECLTYSLRFDEWVLLSRQKYEYDPQGRLTLSELSDRNDDGSWSVRQETSTTFDKNGNESSVVTRNRKGQSQEFWWVKRETSYVADGSRNTVTYKSDDGVTWVADGRTEIADDGSRSYRWTDGGWVLTSSIATGL